jgi:dTDP-glucose 4,6-dehydratase
VPKPHPPLFGLPAADLAQVMTLAAADLQALRGARIFITGGTGFFGKWLVAALTHANAELELGLAMTILSRDPQAFCRRFPALENVPGLEFIAGQVANFELPGRAFDFIVHAAADTALAATPAEEAERSRSIIEGTRRVLELAKTSATRRLLQVSSGAVYGAMAAQPSGACEDDMGLAQTLTPYGSAKREAEHLCADSGVDCVVARAFAFLGPYLPLDAHFAAGNFLRDARRGGPIEVRGDGTAVRSYLHPADLVVWQLRLVTRGARGRAYNVGSDEAMTTEELARLIAAGVSPAPEVVIQSAQPNGPQNIYLPNIDRARSELQLEVSISLREAIARTLAFLR